MKWETDAKMDKERVIDVPVNGDIYVFKCKNYGNFGFRESWKTTRMSA